MTQFKMEHKVFCLAFGLLFIAYLPINAARVKYKGELNIKLGEPFTISCLVNNTESVRWTKNGKELLKDDGYIPKERQVNESTVESTLTIIKAGFNDSGIYKCVEHEAHHHIRVTDEDQGTIKARTDNETDSKIFIAGQANSFKLACDVTFNPTRDYTLVWKKEIITNNTSEWVEVTSMKNTRYTITPAKELITLVTPDFDDAGNYECSVKDSPTLSAKFAAVSQLYISKFQKDVMAVEGEKLTVTCNVKGNPEDIHWFFTNETLNGTEITPKAFNNRVDFTKNELGTEHGVLIINNTERWDAGTYKCVAENKAGPVENTATIRVKDKYAALWPFLGICAEVFVLCAVILVYEKRRNLPTAERDDSDTDHSPDRKK